MESWLATFDRAARVLQGSDKPTDIAAALKDRCFPIDWIPEDSAGSEGRQILYRFCGESLSAGVSTSGDRTVQASGTNVKLLAKSKPRDRSLLMLAAKFGRTECAKWLVCSAHANPLVACKFDGNTAPHICVVYGKVDTLQYFLTLLGPRCKLWLNKAGETLIDVARRCSHLHKFSSAGVVLSVNADECGQYLPPGDVPSALTYYIPTNIDGHDAVSDDWVENEVRNEWYCDRNIPHTNCVSLCRYQALSSHTYPYVHHVHTPQLSSGPDLSTYTLPRDVMAADYDDITLATLPSQSPPLALILHSKHGSGSVGSGSYIIVKCEALNQAKGKLASRVAVECEMPPGVGPLKPRSPLDIKGLYTIGREISEKLEESEKGVAIPDHRVSKCHCVIRYNAAMQSFEVADAGSANGTYVNGVRLSLVKECSGWRVLREGDVLKIGSSEFVVSYDRPDVGMSRYKRTRIFPAVPTTLTPADMKTNDASYRDRAAERRERYADNPDEPDVVTAGPIIPQPPAPLPDSHVGFKLLAKMGWKSGEGLGKGGSGITAPVQALGNVTRAGLGVEGAVSEVDGSANVIDDKRQSEAVQKRKATIHNITLQRYLDAMREDDDVDGTSTQTQATVQANVKPQAPVSFKLGVKKQKKG